MRNAHHDHAPRRGRPEFGPRRAPGAVPDPASDAPFDPPFGRPARPHRRHPGHFDGDGARRGGPRGRGRRPGGPRRAGRGDVRTAVLLLLAEDAMYGYQLMQTITDRTHGAWRPSAGAIYPVLAQLEDEGLVRTAADGGRKLASLTDEGRAHVDEQRPGWTDPFESATATAGPDLRTAVHALRDATRQVVTTGTPEQVAAAEAVLTDAKRALYLILADAAPDGAVPDRARSGGANTDGGRPGVDSADDRSADHPDHPDDSAD